MRELPQADRFSDNRDDNPYWNESVWFSFSEPTSRIHGFVQYYFRPNMGMLNGGPVMWDPSGTFQWNCLYYNWSHLQAMPPGAEKFDMTARNSLSVKVLEPLERYSIRYDKDGFELDLEWRAIGPIHELGTADTGQQATGRFHLEQPGRMRGTIRRGGGQEIAIECYSMRDTSFGPREYESLASGGYFWGIARDSSFHAIAMSAAGERDAEQNAGKDGREGSEQHVIGGFIWKDGKMSSLVAGTRRVTQYGAFGPRRVLFDAIDDLGRTISAVGRVDDGLVFTGYTDHTVVWSLVEWDWDGSTHWGDNQEFCSAVKFRQVARGELPLG
jgi:hypothetical protein